MCNLLPKKILLRFVPIDLCEPWLQKRTACINATTLKNMIGIFDSGSGGLTVLRAVRARAPLADIVYFGDLAHMPYGGRSQAELQKLTVDAMSLLRREGADYLVSACNSVSASVIRPMMDLLGATDSTVTEMVGPAVRGALAFGEENIVVLATAATIESGMYQRAFADRGVYVTAIPVSGLADAIEFDDDERARGLISPVAARLEMMRPRVVVLACTHYPLATQAFREIFGQYNMGSVHIFDPSDAVAKEVVARCGHGGTGKTRIIISADNEPFKKRAREFNPQVFVLATT